LVIPTSRWMTLGSAILTGLILACGLTASTPSQTALATTISRSSIKPVLVASSVISSGTYTEAVRKQMHWISLEKSIPAPVPVPAPNASVEVVAQISQPSKPTTSQTAENQKKPVQVAESAKQQVSRSDSSDSSTLINNALSLVGIPYVFGGTSRSGFDCSGYTQYVFKGSGISLPRTSDSQFNVGSSITRETLQAGDLVFFSTYNDGPSHVGIYIGGGNFVHASNTGVRTTNINEGYYDGRYRGARRVK